MNAAVAESEQRWQGKEQELQSQISELQGEVSRQQSQVGVLKTFLARKQTFTVLQSKASTFRMFFLTNNCYSKCYSRKILAAIY